jgi:hypothetical protein
VDTITLGILDYLNDGQQMMLEEHASNPNTSFLLKFYPGMGWKRVLTENVIEADPSRNCSPLSASSVLGTLIKALNQCPQN